MAIGGDEKELLARGLELLEIPACPAVVRCLILFVDELLLWNRKTNLVGTTDRRRVIVRHVFDSLSAYRFIKNRKEPILDIGAGAGFPSVPLAVVDGSLSIVAVEKRKKRAMFLQNAAALLFLRNFSVLERDVREIRGAFGTVLARGVGELTCIHQLSRGLLKENGMIIAFKGKMSEIEKEVARLKGRADLEKGVSLHIQKVTVPFLEEEERNIVIIETK